MSKLIGDEKPDERSISLMRKGGGDWYAYQNHALDSENVGHLQFLMCGSNCTYKDPPKHLPDSHLGIGWRYLLVGKVNLKSGEIKEIKQ